MRNVITWLAGCLVVIISLTTYGQVIRTAKSGTFNWNQNGAWQPSGVPAVGDIVILQSGSNIRVNINTATVASITIQAGGTLTAQLTNTISTSGDFSNSGTFIGAVGSLTVGGTLTNSSSFTAGTGAITVSGGLTNTGTFTGNSGNISVSGAFSNTGNFTSGAGAISCGSFSNGGSFTGNTGAFTLSGNFTNNGTFNAGTGVLTFSGTSGSTQTISGSSLTTFDNITVANGGAGIDVQVTSPQQLLGVLTLTGAARFDVTGSDNFTLLSLSDAPVSDASIAALPSGASVTGNITVQRYISTENRVYRYISSPISGITAADWQDDFAITGNFSVASTTDPDNGSTTICGTAIRPTSPSMYSYNEGTSGVRDLGWVAYTGGGIQSGRGYAPFIRESCYREVIIDATGTVHQGNIALPVSYTDSGAPDEDGWNLVGNPYPSAIVWNTDGNGWSMGTNISTSALVRDNISGSFIPVVPGGEIAQGQAFWVKALGTTNINLTIQETAKVASTSVEFYRVAAQANNNLKLSLTKGDLTDIAYYRVVEGAENGFERHDLTNHNNDLFDVGFKSGNLELAVNAVPSVACGEELAIVLKDVTEGSYQISIDKEGLFSGFDVVVMDKFTNSNITLTEGASYSFEVTSDAASKATDRFELMLTLNSTPVVTGNISCNGSPTTLMASGMESVEYRWYASMDATTAVYQGNSFIIPEPVHSTYYVAAMNAFGCEGPRMPVEVVVQEFAPAEITLAGRNKLASNYESGNQWYFNNQKIEGATGKTLLTSQSGQYRLDVTINGCISSTYFDQVLVRADDNRPVLAYPNPFDAQLRVEILGTAVQQVQLVNGAGRVVSDISMKEITPGVWVNSNDLSNVPSGIYFVRSIVDNKAVTLKVIKE